MISQLIEFALGILILLAVIRAAAYVRRYSSQEDVIQLLGDALSLGIGNGNSNRSN